MISFGLVLSKLSTLCLLFTFTIAHEDQGAPSSRTLPTPEVQPLETNSQTRGSVSSDNPVFTFTPPFASQTLVSISVPLCHLQDHSLSPLGCREPSTSLTSTNLPAPRSTSHPAEATDVVWKTIRVTVTKTRTVFRPQGSTLETYTSNHKEPQLSHRAEPGSITKVNSGDQISIQAIITVTSVLDSWGIPQEPDTYTPPPLSSTSADGPPTSTTVNTITDSSISQYGSPSPTVRNQYPTPTPCSANTAQDCVDIGGRTFVVGVSNGQAVLTTDSVLHSTATKAPSVAITPVTEALSSERSFIPSSTSGSSWSTSSGLAIPNSSSSSSSPSASSQTSPTTSTGLRKTKNPWLLLAVCCAGAMMYEIGVWTEKTEEEKAKAAEEEAKKKSNDKAEKKDTNDEVEEDESAGKSKENVQAQEETPVRESLNEWNIL
ncbi:hypothetical protein BKA64DRAFT_142439 [Cadophora sp. MPI-SDFR-AT-0126]|nr:hypothetical protein BKA64DRAFT_142439 [Leotiomycetes sp. MPI-SDFR-AT-0126]